MAWRRVILGVACLVAAGVADAAAPPVVRLPLDLASLGPGPEIAYRPYRWLTIRRSLPVVRTAVFVDGRNGSPSLVPLRRAEMITGDIHLGDGLRLVVGLRREKNHRLLRMGADDADTGPSRYRPVVAVGWAGEAAPGLAFGADTGFFGRSFAYAGGVELVTPIEQAGRRKHNGASPFARVSASFRF